MKIVKFSSNDLEISQGDHTELRKDRQSSEKLKEKSDKTKKFLFKQLRACDLLSPLVDGQLKAMIGEMRFELKSRKFRKLKNSEFENFQNRWILSKKVMTEMKFLFLKKEKLKFIIQKTTDQNRFKLPKYLQDLHMGVKSLLECKLRDMEAPVTFGEIALLFNTPRTATIKGNALEHHLSKRNSLALSYG